MNRQSEKEWKARVFKAALSRLEKGREKNWMSVDAKGHLCHPSSNKAIGWCPIGAIIAEGEKRGIPFRWKDNILTVQPVNAREDLCLDLHMFCLHREGQGIADFNMRASDEQLHALLNDFGRIQGFIQ